MEVSLRITPLARQDIIEIADHIAQDSLKAADGFLDAIETACTRLTPELGELCRFASTELADVRVRTIPDFENYLIFYRVCDVELLVLRVIHGARDWQSLFVK